MSIPDALANVRYRLKRMAGADRALSVDERGEIVAFVERCRTAMATEPDIADEAELAEVDELLAADAS